MICGTTTITFGLNKLFALTTKAVMTDLVTLVDLTGQVFFTAVFTFPTFLVRCENTRPLGFVIATMALHRRAKSVTGSVWAWMTW